MTWRAIIWMSAFVRRSIHPGRPRGYLGSAERVCSLQTCSPRSRSVREARTGVARRAADHVDRSARGGRHYEANDVLLRGPRWGNGAETRSDDPERQAAAIDHHGLLPLTAFLRRRPIEIRCFRSSLSIRERRLDQFSGPAVMRSQQADRLRRLPFEGCLHDLSVFSRDVHELRRNEAPVNDGRRYR